ncbi:hypothetical protein NQ314_006079 [Rhamnusium bicolor]|uniref:Protein AATF n=1 Tax=Rhamnusium bicolor TaxID=1586634 RepID=A0AAV8Z910_9CUCU|nr:hypothetical protein NQ314_006079 [Rhamnusium bicolor]
MIKRNKETLADRIAGVLNTTPARFDPEDENFDDTRAQLNIDHSDENDVEEEILSEFRKQNVNLLADVDEKYAGKRGSRKSLEGSDVDSAESDEELEADVPEDSETYTMEDENQGQNQRSNLDQSEEEESNEEDEKGNSGSDDDDMDYEDDSEVIKGEDNFKIMADTDVSSQVRKGLSVRNQMKMWESLLEMRIQLQKCLITANKMPQSQTFSEIKKESGQEFSHQVAVTKHSLGNVLDKLLLLKKLVLKKYPETKNLDKEDTKVMNENIDEEIASDTEDEKSIQDSEDEEREIPNKKRKLDEFEKEIAEQHYKYKNYRNTVIQKWNEKTRIAVMKNNTNSHSVINHIEHTLSDRAKLLKRTRLKRSEYTILGQEPAKESEKQDDNIQDIRPAEEYNSEIFDDDDFYHQLLRELIEVKSADLTDPVQLGRQWIQLQNLRSKMKRKVDTRATKGRKIRYAIHTKLVNFMAPFDENVWTDDAKTDLYNSLFGKNQRCETA